MTDAIKEALAIVLAVLVLIFRDILLEKIKRVLRKQETKM